MKSDKSKKIRFMRNRLFTAAGSVGKAFLQGKIKYLIFHVTSRCNAKCRMCFNWDGMEARRGESQLTLPEFVETAKGIKLLPQLTLSGGEPLLRDDLADIIKAFYDHAQTRFFTVPTNGLSPERLHDLIERFETNAPGAYLNVCLPFHGTGALFEDILGVPGSYDKFEKSYAVIAEAKKRYPNISCALNFVMNKFNHEEYKQTIDFARKEFPDTPIGVAYARGETHEKEAVEFPIESYMAAQEYVRKSQRKKSTANPYTLMNESIGRQISDVVAGVARGEVTKLNCKAAKNFLVIYETGDVYSCELINSIEADQGNHESMPACLGSLRNFDYDVYRLLDSKHAKDIISRIQDKGCVCTWECAIYSNIIHSPMQIARLGLNMCGYLLKPQDASGTNTANGPQSKSPGP